MKNDPLHQFLVSLLAVIAMMAALPVYASAAAKETVAAGNHDLFVQADFKAGAAYEVTVSWASAPIFSGPGAGWTLQTLTNEEDGFVGSLILKAAKKNHSGTDSSIRAFTGYFVASKDASILNLNIQGLAEENTVSVAAAPCNIAPDVILDATISTDTAVEYLCAFFDADFETGTSYQVDAFWSTVPHFTDANEGNTAWKVQAAESSNVFGDDSVIYKITSANNTAPQSYSGIFDCKAAKPVFNFFTQRLNSANTVHLVVKTAARFCLRSCRSKATSTATK